MINIYTKNNRHIFYFIQTDIYYRNQQDLQADAVGQRFLFKFTRQTMHLPSQPISF